MPNRILREGILTSERVDQLDWSAEVFYRRLMSVVDDYGRYDARVAVLRATLYPLRLDRLREADVQRWIAECEKAGLIVLYQVEGRSYLQLLHFRQDIRAKKSKWPDPPVDARMCAQMSADENRNCEARSPPSSSPSPSSSFSSSKTSKAKSSSEKGDTRGKIFVIPSVEEIAAYCAEQKYQVDPQEFVDYYTANGWVQGKSQKPIRDWKAAIRIWQRNNFSKRNGINDPRGNLATMRSYLEDLGQ